MNYRYLLLTILCFLTVNEVYASHQWTQRTNFGALGRHRAVGISIANKGYIGLGHYNGTGVETYFSDWWEFDPASNTWTQKMDYPGNNGNGELGAHGIGLESVGYIGLGELDDYSLFKYDPASNTWTEVSGPPASGGSFQDTGDFTIGHKSYFMRIASDQLWEYNADLDLWTQKNPPPFDVYYSSSGFTINGKGYLKVSNSNLLVNDFYEYDPTLDSWTLKAAFPGLARLSSISFVQADKGYIISGYGVNSFSDLTSEVWQYTPSTDSWNQLEDFPGSKRRYSVGLNIGNRCYLGTGTNGTNFNDFWEFDAVAGFDEINESINLSVYPNPVVDQATFECEAYDDFTVDVHSSEGKHVLSGSTHTGILTLDLSNVESGNYNYSVKVNNQVWLVDKNLVIVK